MSDLELKQILYKHCFEFIENRFKTIHNSINEIHESLTSETKSSAGDKHETGRAMLQLEREKAGNQLADIQKTKEAFSKIDTSKTLENVSLGSVVLTSHHNYFIAISAGEIKIDNKLFYAISPNTPIGQLLIGKIIGSDIKFRNQAFKIEDIF